MLFAGLDPVAAQRAEQHFDAALEAARNGNLELAEFLLEVFAIEHPTQRVLLELGRIQFNQGKYKKARDSFKQVQKLNSLPLNVREKVDYYLRRIDLAIGFLRYDIGLRTDDNPLNFTDTDKVKIGPYEFDLVAPTEDKNIYGLRHRLQFARVLSREHGVNLSGTITLSDYENSFYDRFNFYSNLTKYLSVPVLESASIFYSEESDRDGKIYNQTGISLSTRGFKRVLDARLNITTARSNVFQYDYLDARRHQFEIVVPYSFAQDTGYISAGRTENLTASEADSYSGNNIGVFYNTKLRPFHILLRLNGTYHLKKYWEDSPMFMRKREDHTYALQFNLMPELFQFKSYQAEIGLTIEHNQSSIDYYDYEKLIWSLDFKY